MFALILSFQELALFFQIVLCHARLFRISGTTPGNSHPAKALELSGLVL
jgi:hypothetical protein